MRGTLCGIDKGLAVFAFCRFCFINLFFLIYSDWNHVDKHGQGTVCVLALAIQCGFLLFLIVLMS